MTVRQQEICQLEAGPTGAGTVAPARRLSVALLCLLAAAAFVGTAPAQAKETFVPAAPFGETGTRAGQMELASNSGVAVDEATGDIYVADTGNHRIDEFSAAGNFVRAFGKDVGGAGVDICTTACEEGTLGSSPGAFEAPTFVAIDNSVGASRGDVYVADASTSLVSKFEADGAVVSGWGASGQLDGSSTTGGAFAELAGIAVGPGGDLSVFQVEPHRLSRFDQAGAFVEEVETPRGTLPAGLAPEGDGPFFKVNGDGSVEKFEATGADIAQISQPESQTGLSTTGIASDTTTRQLFVDNGVSIAAYTFVSSGEVLGANCTPEEFGGCRPTETFGSGALTAGAGLTFDSTTTTLYAADSDAGHVVPFGYVTLPEAATQAAFVAQTGTGPLVTLHGTINAAGGPAANCRFEYLRLPFPYTEDESFEGAASVPCAPAGPFSGSGPVAVEAQLSGLPEAGYRYRLVAANLNGSVFGALRTFAAFRPSLPDARAYELVSPAVKSGDVYPPGPGGLGNYSSEECPTANTNTLCLPGSGGNETRVPMQTSPDGESIVYEGEQFTAASATGPNEYLSHRAPAGWLSESLSPSWFRSAAFQGYKVFSSDLSRAVLYQTGSGASPDVPTSEGLPYPDLYLRAADGTFQPLVVNAPPNRQPGPASGANRFQIDFAAANSGTPGVPPLSHVTFAANDALTAAVAGVAPPAPEVAPEGEGIWNPATEKDLYEWSESRLHLINVLPGNTQAAPRAVIGSGCQLSACTPNLEGGPLFDHAVSADGTRVFWSDETGQVYIRVNNTETLKVKDPGRFLDASADGTRAILDDGCLYDVAAEECEDLTEDEAGLSQGGFQGLVGVDEDLSHVYFVDTQTLTGPNQEGRSPNQGGPEEYNLYSWHGGETVFVATLSASDNEGSYGDWKPASSSRTSQTTADGGVLAFMSTASLTGYDNSISGGGSNCPGEPSQACSEVYEYDAAAGSLRCVSCNVNGQRPLGGSNLSLVARTADYTDEFPQLRNLVPSGNGKIFFESQDVLSPRDANGKIQDLYEWEPAGDGGCSDPAGCVSLISGGNQGQPAFFLDSTPSGDDAFFVTRTRLVPQDTDERLDLYDARVGGGFAPGTELPPCSGEACRGPGSSALPESSPRSNEFAGPGNSVPPTCHRGSRRALRHGRVVCVRRRSGRRGSPKHHRQKHRRSGRALDRNRGGPK